MANVGIEKIGQIHITVADLERSVAFYRDVLGMALLFDVPEQSMAFFDCGGVRLYLGKAEESGARSRPMIYYTVGQIDEACAAVREGGAELGHKPHIVHRTEAMELWMASVPDPDGNHVMLMEERSVRARSPERRL